MPEERKAEGADLQGATRSKEPETFSDRKHPATGEAAAAVPPISCSPSPEAPEGQGWYRRTKREEWKEVGDGAVGRNEGGANAQARPEKG